MGKKGQAKNFSFSSFEHRKSLQASRCLSSLSAGEEKWDI
ncbi:hypothetical protein QY97_01295 [Bacillus thermotolerans]|nr:hypothetical protein QY97_01295 [Bacillus thermotolerans]